MAFTENSPLVQAWVRQIKNGTYTKENVPEIGNLREVVYSLLEG